jgi:hypothetical protein
MPLPDVQLGTFTSESRLRLSVEPQADMLRPRDSQAQAGEKRIMILESAIWNLDNSMSRDLECCWEAPSPSEGG